ncbi:hypothetical protein [Harryflintia acetispora]|uniref:hypothetical protein n=1 Tax=Harryflintia acetispora TaxID=1849041 RepID=UPI0018981611|nr:hypothetical protein [Harryflintia acetispora]
MPFLFSGDFHVHAKTIKGVQYVTFSFFSGEQTIFDKVGEMIVQSCVTAKKVEIPSESLVGSGIALDGE